MQKWSRRKAQLSFFLSLSLSLFALFMLSFHLTSKSTKTVRVGPAGSSLRSQPSFPTYITTNISSPLPSKNWVLDASDWSKACTSTRSYNGRSSLMLGHRRESKQTYEQCDMFSGRWVCDNVSFPLYNEAGCPYMSDQLACTKHGRPDKEYQRWRWQPHRCDLKSWNGAETLEKL